MSQWPFVVIQALQAAEASLKKRLLSLNRFHDGDLPNPLVAEYDRQSLPPNMQKRKLHKPNKKSSNESAADMKQKNTQRFNEKLLDLKFHSRIPLPGESAYIPLLKTAPITKSALSTSSQRNYKVASTSGNNTPRLDGVKIPRKSKIGRAHV